MGPNPERRTRSPSWAQLRAAPRSNLSHVADDYHYRVEMSDGEVITGALLDVAPDGVFSLELPTGEVLRRSCAQLRRLTAIDDGRPV
jgi:hypothetical protein